MNKPTDPRNVYVLYWFSAIESIHITLTGAMRAAAVPFVGPCYEGCSPPVPVWNELVVRNNRPIFVLQRFWIRERALRQ